jgi:small GTP-binding protein
MIDAVSFRLIFWDIAGQPTFERMRQKFYSGSSGAIIAFSHSPDEKKSFKSVEKWLSEVEKHCGNIQIALFGNKIDLIDEEELQSSEYRDSRIEGYVKDHNFLGYYKTSALTGQGVNEAFYALTKRLYSLRNY